MKKLLILALFAILPCIASAQEDHFKVEDFQMIWQQVFSSELNSDVIINFLKTSGDIKDVMEVPNGATFKVSSSAPVDILKYGYKRGTVAVYVVLNLIEGNGIIEFKDGRYRVTVKDILFISNDSQSERTKLETYALSRKGEIKKVFYSMNAAGPLDDYFTDLFTPKIKSNDEW